MTHIYEYSKHFSRSSLLVYTSILAFHVACVPCNCIYRCHLLSDWLMILRYLHLCKHWCVLLFKPYSKQFTFGCRDGSLSRELHYSWPRVLSVTSVIHARCWLKHCLFTLLFLHLWCSCITPRLIQYTWWSVGYLASGSHLAVYHIWSEQNM
jgi:hypothetical protein